MRLLPNSKFLLRHLAASLGLIVVAFATPRAVNAADVTEYDLKALYLYHFTQFVTWPEEVISEELPIVIGIMGRNPFGGRLERVIEQQSAANPGSVIIERVNTLQEARDCHVLFISRSESRNLRSIIEAVDGLPILTVGDDASFALRGCLIGFYTEDNKVRIAINERVANEANLTLSSKLLRIATVR